MEEVDLIERIKWLNDPNGGNIHASLLCDDVFINLPENKQLNDAFKLK